MYAAILLHVRYGERRYAHQALSAYLENSDQLSEGWTTIALYAVHCCGIAVPESLVRLFEGQGDLMELKLKLLKAEDVSDEDIRLAAQNFMTHDQLWLIVDILANSRHTTISRSEVVA